MRPGRPGGPGARFAALAVAAALAGPLTGCGSPAPAPRPGATTSATTSPSGGTGVLAGYTRRWTVPALGGEGGFGALTVTADAAYASTLSGVLERISPADGSLLWRYNARRSDGEGAYPGLRPFPDGAGRVWAGPLALDAATGRPLHGLVADAFAFADRGRVVVASAGTSEVMPRALDPARGRVVWTSASATTEAVRSGRLLCGGNGTGELACLDTATGALRWRRQAATVGGVARVTRTASGAGVLVAVTTRGAGVVLQSFVPATGRVLWTARLPRVPASGITVTGDTLVYLDAVAGGAGGSGAALLVARSASTGKVRWSADAGAGAALGNAGRLPVLSGAVLVSTPAGLAAFALADGTPAGTLPRADRPAWAGVPVVANGHIYVPDATGVTDWAPSG